MKPKQQRSGTVRCQRCLKFGHYTYECQNQVAYRYRPSRTVMYKEQIKLALNNDRGPQTVIRNPDKLRRVQDRPSSSDEEQNKNQKHVQIKQTQNPTEQVKFQDSQNAKDKILDHNSAPQEQESQSSSSSSSSSDSSSSSSSSSSDSDSESAPQKKRKL